MPAHLTRPAPSLPQSQRTAAGNKARLLANQGDGHSDATLGIKDAKEIEVRSLANISQ
jgi:hypothetical protein